MQTCPKCFKQSPVDAAFCGFCGAGLKPAPQDAGKKTVFGYRADIVGQQPADAGKPADAARPVLDEPPTVPYSRDDVEAVGTAAGAGATGPAGAVAPAGSAAPGEGLLGGRFALSPGETRLPAGALYSARDTVNEAEVQVFVADPELFSSPLDMERARRETRQLQKVEAEEILTILDHGKLDDGRLYVVCEPFSGRTLADVVSAAGPLTLERVQELIKRIGGALAKAQKVGVIHRDIAPHNVLIGDDGSVKVWGFGIAPPIKRNVVGTAEFISPEQCAGRPVDQRSNIYSLGALMHLMLTGRPPFVGTTEEVLEAHQKREPEPIDRQVELPKRAAQLIHKALAKSSSRRHLTLRQFLRELDGIGATADAPPALPQQPASFETPLHGVTALIGGDRPPSSEVQMVSPQPAAAVDGRAKTMLASAEQGVEGQSVTAPPDQGSVPMAPVGPDVPVPTAQPASPAVTPEAGAVVGEMAKGHRVVLRQSSEIAQVEGAAGAPDAQPTAQPTAADAPKARAGFRETMWFFKGEVESEMAQKGEGEPPPPEEQEDLASKYRDDGSMTEDEARRLSLRTGKTAMMQAVKVPDGRLPGEEMRAEDFISEMHRGRTIAIWIGIILVLGAIIAAVLYFVL